MQQSKLMLNTGLNSLIEWGNQPSHELKQVLRTGRQAATHHKLSQASNACHKSGCAPPRPQPIRATSTLRTPCRSTTKNKSCFCFMRGENRYFLLYDFLIVTTYHSVMMTKCQYYAIVESRYCCNARVTSAVAGVAQEHR